MTKNSTVTQSGAASLKKKDDIKSLKIAVIGAGIMGGGIAQLFAANKFKTLIWDINTEVTQKGYQAILTRLKKSAAKGSITGEEASECISRISRADSLHSISDCDFVIEAAIEKQDIKEKLFSDLEKVLSQRAIIATNTSSLSVCDLAKKLAHPERFLGVHFFNPPTKLELVEIISTPLVSAGICSAVCGLITACGKTPVMVKDSPGFIVNRLLFPYINEAVKLLETGVTKAEDIDTAMQLGALHQAGPLKTADLVGLDVCRHILETLAESCNNPAYLPAKKIIELTDAGNLGRKTGKGFYEY